MNGKCATQLLTCAGESPNARIMGDASTATVTIAASSTLPSTFQAKISPGEARPLLASQATSSALAPVAMSKL
jgi:hypothetical protein